MSKRPARVPTHTVSQLTVESGEDLVIGFAVNDPDDRVETESLILQRTPTYESLLDPHERGVKLSFGSFDALDEGDLLEAVEWDKNTRVIRLETRRRTYQLDLSAADSADLEDMRKVLTKMNFDDCFRLPDTLALAMEGYDADASPQPDEWLATDEIERLLRIENYHRKVLMPDNARRLHASLHLVVENQLAMKEDPVVRALARLMRQGLSRHDAVHAIGCVLAENLRDRLQASEPDEADNAHYYAALERLTADVWRTQYGDG